MDTLEETVRVATSKPVQRAAVNTLLLVSSAVTLFCLAVIATGLFFQNFVPEKCASTPVHLQYGSGPNPYGVASLNRPPMMKAQQEYDITVTLSMPRSPPNVERGNFMVTLYLLGSDASERLEADARSFAHTHFGSHKIIFTSRRPALVPYIDPMVSVARRLLLLLYHMLVPSSQTYQMTVALAERLAFSKGSALPASAYVEVEAGQDIQIYSVTLTMTAQLRGLRWLMFHYRLPTYTAFTFMFWSCEVSFMCLAWAISGAVTRSKAPRKGQGRRSLDGEDVDQGGDKDTSSDHPHSFPTYGRQPPLKHEPEVKDEDDGQGGRRISEIPLGGAEADDEDELDDGKDGGGRWRYDSGLGTSYSEQGSPSVRRRAARDATE